MTLLQQDPGRPRPHPALGALPAGFGGAAALALASCAAALALAFPGAGPVAAGAALLATVAAVAATAILAERSYPHPVFGGCNAVTLARGGLVAALLAPLLSGAGAGWPVALVAVLGLSLDGVDGWLARRAGLVSDFGARFDMEVDSALAAVLSLLALVSGATGPAILILGFARYAFVAASLALPWLARPLPPSFARKAICVLQIATLIAIQVPVLPAVAASLLTWAAAAALAWSFGRDILWLHRTRA